MIPTAILIVLFWLIGWAITSTVLLVLLLFMLNFFRDPERDIPPGDDLFVCPDDYDLHEKVVTWWWPV